MPAIAGRLWHDERMLQLARAIVGILSDTDEGGLQYLIHDRDGTLNYYYRAAA
jgi:hypothetical protein